MKNKDKEKELRAIIKKLRKLFTYVPQPLEGFRHVSHYNAVMRGEMFSGDCDDFAITACDYIMEQTPYAALFGVCLLTDTKQFHAYCRVLDEDGDYFVDHRFSAQVRVKELLAREFVTPIRAFPLDKLTPPMERL